MSCAPWDQAARTHESPYKTPVPVPVGFDTIHQHPGANYIETPNPSKPRQNPDIQPPQALARVINATERHYKAAGRRSGLPVPSGVIEDRDHFRVWPKVHNQSRWAASL